LPGSRSSRRFAAPSSSAILRSVRRTDDSAAVRLATSSPRG
jgi:hypothetical protein